MTGIFALPDLDLTSKLESESTDTRKKKFLNRLSYNPAGSSGSKGGAGGAFFVSSLNNTTKATVADGASIYSGADGGFTSGIWNDWPDILVNRPIASNSPPA